jgi:lincosamide nucleotidyltransferase B/F
VPDSLGQPASRPALSSKREKGWLLGEALTNIYVGLQREKRGEVLSAMRFIQLYAVDRLLELVEYIAIPKEVHRDTFVNERCFEQQYPDLAPQLGDWMQGYEKNCVSALAILEFLEEHFEVNETMAEQIRELSR